MNEIQQLAEMVQNFSLDSVSQSVLESTRYCILDSIGSALGAARTPEIMDIYEEYKKWSGTNADRVADVWGQGGEMPLGSALLLNGLMAHQLELDDVHTASNSHIGAVVVTAAWTIANAIHANGKALVEAVIVGYEVMARVGMGMNVASNRKRGWHATGIVGTFGAAAASAKLLGLDMDQISYALGIAGSQSAGLWAFLAEGATCKKLSPARAVVNGFDATILSKGGMTGPLHILDAEDGGLYRATSDDFDISRLTSGLGESWAVQDIDKKPYPCCRTTHHAIDAALQLRSQGVEPQDINHILVETYDVGVLQCGFTKYPESYVEAKFSIPYTCAAAFVRGKVTQSEFKGSILNDKMIKRLASHTQVVANELFTARYPKRWGSRMTVVLKDGTRKICQIDDMSGSILMPMTRKQEQQKFMGLSNEIFNKQRATELMKDILKIDTLTHLPKLN